MPTRCGRGMVLTSRNASISHDVGGLTEKVVVNARGLRENLWIRQFKKMRSFLREVRKTVVIGIYKRDIPHHVGRLYGKKVPDRENCVSNGKKKGMVLGYPTRSERNRRYWDL